MAVEVQPRRFTVAEYERMGELGLFEPDERLELIEGEIIRMSPIGQRHMAMVNRFTRRFVESFGRRALVSIQNALIVDDWSEPQPDVVVLRPRADDYEQQKPTSADVLLVVEVADTTLRHDTRKLGLYARTGIPEAWLVALGREPARDVIRVYTDAGPEGYRRVHTYRRGDAIAPAAFPDTPIAVSDILKDLPPSS